jgi:hypothetical protein
MKRKQVHSMNVLWMMTFCDEYNEFCDAGGLFWGDLRKSGPGITLKETG